jgi:RecA-family ATPase
LKNDKETALECLAQLDPAVLEYNDWLQVGMVLHGVGCSVADWDSWSRRDSGRYAEKVCSRKWDGFKGSSKPVTNGFLVQLCRKHGGTVAAKREHHELAWDDFIGGHSEEEYATIRPEYISDITMPPCRANWNAVDDLRRYLSALFTSEEHVCYVIATYPKEGGGFSPGIGTYDRTAGKLIADLTECGGDIANVVGDWNKEAGAWVRFNPMDGKGLCDSNITDYRYALVESDTMEIDRQYSIYKDLELPVAAMVHSAGKSLHAIVKVEAASKDEYRKRVDYLYNICKKAGLVIDGQNRNPSRLSRLPGVTRNGKPQYLVATNTGKANWNEWVEYIEESNDELPDADNLADVFNNLPPLADSLIDGLLRQGHKMLLAGPSKAGKSFLLIALAIAIAEGIKWLGWACTKGRVLYVNLELDKSSCLHRFKDVYEALGLDPANIANIDIWNLRGKAMPMNLLAPKLIRRAAKKHYSAVIIDPLYKIITGDENAADQMSKFCNLFDRVCTELKVATIYCHHHSKGNQGQKRAHDRSSGSGVFARDPDALIDIIELELDDKRRETIGTRFACDKIIDFLAAEGVNWKDTVSQDDELVLDKLMNWISSDLYATAPAVAAECRLIEEAERANATIMSAWRVEGILREYQAFTPRRMFFRYPIHHMDEWELLTDARAEGEEPPRRKKEHIEKPPKKTVYDEMLEEYYLASADPKIKEVTVKVLAKQLKICEKTVRDRIKKMSQLKNTDGVITEVEQ